MPTLIELDDVTPRIAYTATAAQTDFTVPFVFFADTDLLVYVDDVLQTLGANDDYTATGTLDSEPAARKVIFNAGLVGGESVVIVRDIPVERTTNFPLSGPLQIGSLNLQLAKLFAIQQQMEMLIVRTLRLADSDTEENLDIPAAATRASKFLAFDADGAPTVAAAVTEVPVSAFMATVLDDLTAAAARATLGITDTTAYTGLANWHTCR